VAVVENGAVQELHVERTLERGLVGNVYLGKVARVLPGMQSAFIDIGLERAAFLHVADVWHRQPDGEPPAVKAARAACRCPSSARCSKARPSWCRSSRTRSAPRARACPPRSASPGAAGAPAAGRPHRHVAEDRLARAARAAARAHAGAGGPEGGGFILRTNAEDATDAELADDIAYLRKTWARIRERGAAPAAGHAAAPGPEPGCSACCATWSATAPGHPHRLARAVRRAARPSA
jgi:ribonuclease G